MRNENQKLVRKGGKRERVKRSWGKSDNNFNNRNKQKCGKTRRELNGAMACKFNINYIGLLIY